MQRLMDIILRGLNYDICLAYLDDIILHSDNMEQHIERLEMLLARLQQANLKLKPSKCKLLQEKVEFLGHLISAAGVETCSEKIRAVEEWPTPTTVRQVRSFLGLAGHYRDFIKGYASIAAPLHALTGKNKRFTWNEECQLGFETLKRALTSAPILSMRINQAKVIILCQSYYPKTPCQQ